MLCVEINGEVPPELEDCRECVSGSVPTRRDIDGIIDCAKRLLAEQGMSLSGTISVQYMETIESYDTFSDKMMDLRDGCGLATDSGEFAVIVRIEDLA